MSDLKPGDHLCQIYGTEKEFGNIVIPWLIKGLQQNEKTVYITDARDSKTIMNHFKKAGFDAAPYISSGQFSIITCNESYLKDGVFDPDRMIELLKSVTEKAVNEGCSAFRVTGEMTWALRNLPGVDRLAEYEAKLNNFFPGSRALAICQYDRSRFSPAILLNILKTHPLVIIGTELCNNPFYMPPSCPADISAETLKRWMENLLEHKKAEEGVRREEKKTEELLSKLKTANEKLKSAQEELIRKEKMTAIGTLAAAVSHELRNPLAVIGMTIQFMESKFDRNDPRRELIKAIIKKVERLDRITKELANFNGIVKLNFRNCNLAKCLDLNLALIKPYCRSQKIKVKKRFLESLYVEMDDEQMDKVFFNVMNNAVQAMRKGGVLTVSAMLDKKTKRAIIKIHNTGPAIGEKHLPHIFEPFFSRDKKGGIGLGLAIAQSIVLRHAGLIAVESKKSGKDKGVAFIIQLPLKQEE